MTEILTIGYGGKKPDVFFAELDALKPYFLVDVRRDPYHAFLGVYTKPYLEKHIDHYLWIHELGNAIKTLPPVLIDEEIGLKKLALACKTAKAAKVPRVILLCAEKDERRCHRLYVKMLFLYGGLRKKVSQCWSVKTSYFGEMSSGSRGQCYVTALLVQGLLGGEILTGKTPIPMGSETHYWNKLPNGDELDLTSDQYNGDGFNPIIEGTKAKRLNWDNKRYKILKRTYLWNFGWSP